MCAIDEKQSMHPFFLFKFCQCPFRRKTVIKRPYQNRRYEAKQKHSSIIKICYCIQPGHYHNAANCNFSLIIFVEGGVIIYNLL